MREKLIELLEEVAEVEVRESVFGTDMEVNYSEIADHLIANGVTVQKWIPVEERLPEKECRCLIWTTIYFIPDHVDECNHYDGIEIAGYHPEWGFLGHYGRNAKAWMPLPDEYKQKKCNP